MSGWEPGDPLNAVGCYPRPIFQLMFDPTGPEPNGDAASWPTPRAGHFIEDDPLGEFIASARRARVGGAA